MKRCPITVYWWDLAMTARCVRVAQHAGAHRDGTRYFDDLGYQLPRDDVRGDRADETAVRALGAA